MTEDALEEYAEALEKVEDEELEDEELEFEEYKAEEPAMPEQAPQEDEEFNTNAVKAAARLKPVYIKKFMRRLPEELEEQLIQRRGITIDRQYVKSILEEKLKIMHRRESVVDCTLEALSAMPVVEHGEMFTLVPLNIMLWLYNLGLNDKKSISLFRTLARSVMLAKRMKPESSTPFSVRNCPVSARALNAIYNPEKNFESESFRSFYMLQAIIAALSCGVTKRNEAILVGAAISNAAPMLATDLGKIPWKFHVKNPYTTAYSPAHNVPWICMLYQVCDYNKAVSACKWMVCKAAEKINKHKRNREITQEDYIARLLTYMQISMNRDPLACFDAAVAGGVRAFW